LRNFHFKRIIYVRKFIKHKLNDKVNYKNDEKNIKINCGVVFENHFLYLKNVSVTQICCALVQSTG